MPELLKAAELDHTSGVLRLRATGPDGAQRGEIVLREGTIVGAAIYRAGGVTGMGDALVEAALCSPEDATAALQIAAARGDQAPHALREGSQRAGVSYAFVVDVLRAHIIAVASVLRGWQNGTFELVLEGFPAGELDRDSASARTFLLDEGMSVAETFEGSAEESVPTPPHPFVPPPEQPPPGASDDAREDSREETREETQGESREGATAPDAWDWGSPTEAPAFSPAEAPPVAEERAPDAAPPEVDWAADETSRDAVRDATRAAQAAADAAIVAAEAAAAAAAEAAARFEAAELQEEAAAGNIDAVLDAAGATASDSAPTRDAPGFVEPPSDAEFPTNEHPSAEIEAWADLPAAEEAPAADADSDPDDDAEFDSDDGTAAGVDLSSPGFGESALMEAETLLDGEVLSVMLEMGNSAAAVAAETHGAATEAVRTGHLVLADEDGQLAALLVPALREAGFVVHPVRGREDARARLDEAAAAGERPLVLCDLLLTRDEGGMLGGLDVAQHATSLSPAPPVVLLAETLSDDVRFRAESARVASILERPLKSELKKDDAARRTFAAQLLVAVDQHRPHAEWRVQGGFSEWTTGEATIDDGWNIDELERRAEEVEDLPDFGIGDPLERRDALWRETMRELAHPLSPPEILLQILRFGGEVLARGVLFTPTSKGELRGFGQFGVELAPGVDPDEAVRQIRVPVRGHPGIDRALDDRLPVRWQPGDSTWEDHLVRALGGIAPREILIGPVFCQGRLAALFYGDMLPSHEAIPDTTNLEVVLGQAGLALDRNELEERLRALEKITR